MKFKLGSNHKSQSNLNKEINPDDKNVYNYTLVDNTVAKEFDVVEE